MNHGVGKKYSVFLMFLREERARAAPARSGQGRSDLAVAGSVTTSQSGETARPSLLWHTRIRLSQQHSICLERRC